MGLAENGLIRRAADKSVIPVVYMYGRLPTRWQLIDEAAFGRLVGLAPLDSPWALITRRDCQRMANK